MSGTAGIQFPIVVAFDQTVVGPAAHNYTMTRAGAVTDAWCISLATAAGATVTVGNAGNAITDAMAGTPVTTLTRAGTITVANSTFIVGDAMRFTTADGGGNDCSVAAFALLIPAVSAPQTI